MPQEPEYAGRLDLEAAPPDPGSDHPVAGDRAAVVADLARRLTEMHGAGRAVDEPSPPPPPRRRRAAGASSDRPRSGRSTGRDRNESEPPDPPGDPAVLARQICLRQLAIAPRSRSQLTQAMRRRGIPDEAAESVLDRLTAVGLVDDAAYAESFVRAKHRDRALGRSALRQELSRVGVEASVADAAVAAVDDESERRRAEEFVARRIGAVLSAGPEAARRRLLGALTRRGYSAEVTLTVVNRAMDDLPGGSA